MQQRVMRMVLTATLFPLVLPAGCRDRGPVAVIQGAGGAVEVALEVAATPAERERGLMYRSSLAEGRGMLFVFDQDGNHTFWMRNTLIPLDMVFIRSDGTIVRIATAKPLDETPVPAGEPVAAVLEIRGGRAAELGIKAGDTVDWPH